MMPPLPGRRPWNQSNPDLQTQFEDLLSAVWAAEEEWRLDDRIDMAQRVNKPDEDAA
jgi:hypothetical protein